MRRVVAGSAIAIGILLLGNWWNSPNSVTPTTDAGPEITRRPAQSDPPAPILPGAGPVTPVRQQPNLRQIELFQRIAKARQTAWLEARALVPHQEEEGGLLPTEPSLARQKGGAKRERLAHALFARAKAEITRAHELTREEIDEIHECGKVERWPLGRATSLANPSSGTDSAPR